MQDVRSQPAGGGNGFFNGSKGGDRRLRPHLHHNQQALKCPRCDSLNTKFCYYNNYNLSQPRHFCKSCRRYWTKGGVLRNVPVGGGCRKSNRSSKVKTSSIDRNSNSHSSSETSTVATPSVSSSNSGSNLMNYPFFEFPPSSDQRIFQFETDFPPYKMQNYESGGSNSIMYDFEVENMDKTLVQSNNGREGAVELDWAAGEDGGLFDLTATVNQCYWTQWP